MAIAGKGGSVTLGTAKITSLTNWKLDISGEIKDITSFDSNGWKENLSTLRGWNGSAEGHWNIKTDAPGQKAIQTALLNGTVSQLKLMVNATDNYSGSALITKISIEEPVDDVVKFSFDFEGTGALTVV